MNPRFLHSCEVFQPAEKACWKILLDEEEEVARIPAAELDAAIDRTLGQLWALLKSHSVKKWLHHAPPAGPRVAPGADCAIEALLAYFTTGQRALRLIADEVALAHPRMSAAERERARKDLDLAFKILVQRELQSLCGSCNRYPHCRFSGKPRLEPQALKRARSRTGDAALPLRGKRAARSRSRPRP